MKSAVVGWTLFMVVFLAACDSDLKQNNYINNTNDIIDIMDSEDTTNLNNSNNINNTNNTNIIPPNQNKTEAQALAQLFPGATAEVATSTSGDYYILRNAQQEVVGYGVADAHYGFNGEVRTLTGISAAGATVGVETISQRESWWSFVPESFFTQFTGILMENVTLLPSYDENCYRCPELYGAIGVDAVSGATYTSDAMIKNVMDGYLHWDEVLSAQ